MYVCISFIRLRLHVDLMQPLAARNNKRYCCYRSADVSCVACICSGVCLGLQCAVIEFARNVLGWADAHSTEADATTTHPVVRTSCL